MTVVAPLNMPVSEIELPAALSNLEASVAQQIHAFLDGDSDGQELLQGLYGDTADEPIPARLAALLQD